jgi:hypothetical protein
LAAKRRRRPDMRAIRITVTVALLAVVVIVALGAQQ